MNKKILRVILIISILLWMSVVFGLSNDTAVKSSSLSLKIAKIFSKDKIILKKLEPIIRKLAHLSEYTLRAGFYFVDFFIHLI